MSNPVAIHHPLSLSLSERRQLSKASASLCVMTI
jgi:hypothetical protein